MTTISKTTITFTVLHRTDEPFTSDNPLMEAMARSMDGHAVGWETGEETVEVPDDQVEAELVELGNDGSFFDDDLEDELIHHLDVEHGIDPNTIEDDHDPWAIHAREHEVDR